MLKSDNMERSCIWNFKPVKKNKQLPKSWEEFCEMYPVKNREFFITNSSLVKCIIGPERDPDLDKNLLPDRATAEAYLALCQLIQIRNAYNGDWVPEWKNGDYKFMIEFREGEIYCDACRFLSSSPLYFKTEELCYKFLKYFRPLIEKLKPLYSIKEGGEEC